MNRIILGMVALCLLLNGCKPESGGRGRTLRVLVGSSMAAPVQEIGREFGRRYGVEVEYDLGGSETLLPKIVAGAPAEVFVCHDPFEAKVRQAGRHAGSVVVGYLEPVLVVRPGNPQAIASLEDLSRSGLKLGIGDARYSTCGELFVGALRQRGLGEAVMANVMLEARGHAELANGLILGPLDAAVVWNFIVPEYSGKLQEVKIGVSYPETRITVVGLSGGGDAGLRDLFVEYCRQPEVRRVFVEHGYVKAAGGGIE